MISLSIILCLVIHSSRSKHSRKTTASNLHKHHFRVMVFNFDCRVHLFRAIVDFLVLEVLNSNNLFSEVVVGLKQFYPKSFRKQFCMFLKRPEFIDLAPASLT